jgi:hypothetical protein
MLRENTVLTIIHDSYIKEIVEFNEKKLIKDSAKILQLVYIKETVVEGVRKYILTMYLWQVKRLVRLKKPTLEEKKETLILFISKLKEKFPEEFTEIGWWDLKVAMEKD